MRFIFIDRITEIEKGKQASGIKNLAMSEDYFEHHFPFFPVMPGVLILEAMVELSRWLVVYSADFKVSACLQQVYSLKLREPVHPGDSLRVRVEWQDGSAQAPLFYGRVFLAEKPIAEARFDTRLIPIDDPDWERRLSRDYRSLTVRLKEYR